MAISGEPPPYDYGDGLLSLHAATCRAVITLLGDFEGPAREIPTPPSDHIPLRRRCVGGGMIPRQTTSPRVAHAMARLALRPGGIWTRRGKPDLLVVTV
jgi:hypothetical protein